MSFWQLAYPAERVALVDEYGRRVSYSELAALTVKFQAAIGGADQERQLGFVICNNDVGTVAAYLAGLRFGHPLALLDSKLHPDLLHRLIEVYKPEWVRSSKPVVALVESEAVHSSQSHPEFGNLYRLTWSPAEREAIHPDCALLLSTSGTTGSPKFVRLSQANLAANAGSIASYLQLDETERPITSLPLHYSYGLSVLNSHLLVGATVILSEQSIIAKPFWSCFQREQATSLAGVPFTYQMLDRMRMLQAKLPSLRSLTQAGGRLDPALAESLSRLAAERGWRFFIMYGQTEATARMSYLPADQVSEKPTSIGVPIPGGRFELAADGELIYFGANVMLGYAETRADLGRGDVCAGRLSTGDLARVDEHGFYYITGRKNRFLKLFGLRISLDETERQLQAAFEGQMACVGHDDRLVVFAECEASEVLAGIKEFLVRTYQIHHSALDVRSVAALPRTSSGKPDYKLMNEWVNA